MPAHEQETAISLAYRFGMFEVVSILLGSVAIILVLGGVFAFLNFRSIARKVARKEAERTARVVAEQRAVEYLQDELPRLIEEYRELARNAVGDEEADEIARAQPDAREGDA